MAKPKNTHVPKAKITKIAVLVGSPRVGHSTMMANNVIEGIEKAGAVVDRINLAEMKFSPCDGCEACYKTGDCKFSDDANKVFDRLDQADGLVVITPVYFAGVPALLKALLDRCQYRWSRRYLLETQPILRLQNRKPFQLIIIGSGKDSFGCEGVVTSCTSALRQLDFEMIESAQFMGYRDPDDETHPREYELEARGYAEDFVEAYFA